MNETLVAAPRWGNEGRDRKAMAILRTLAFQCGDRIASGTWIDIGCGSGGIARTLAPHVDRIIGVDPEPWPSWPALTEGQTNLSFLAAGFDGDQLPCPDETADVVICNQVYEHVAHPATLIHNIYRVLKPGGVCYFAGPNLLWPIEPHVFWPFVHWLPRTTAHQVMRWLGSKQPESLDAYSTHVWQLRRWIGSCQLEWHDAVPLRAAAGLAVRGHSRMARMIKYLPGPLFAPFKAIWPSFVFVLRKPA